VAWALATGERLTATTAVGVVLGLLAVLLLTVSPSGRSERSSGLNIGMIALAAIGGITWGFATVALDYAPSSAGSTPAVVGAITAFVIVAVPFAVARKRFDTGFTPATIRDSALSGGLFGFANAFILLALVSGGLALVGMLTAMYPLATVILARFALKEHISRVQVVGIIAAVSAAALMSIG
jgi:drug/metabolite transporter (DMT)-like permease